MSAPDKTTGSPPGLDLDVAQMQWGEWRASAIKRNAEFHRITLPDGGKGWSINDDCLPVDGPYCETKKEAIAALLEQLKNV